MLTRRGPTTMPNGGASLQGLSRAAPLCDTTKCVFWCSFWRDFGIGKTKLRKLREREAPSAPHLETHTSPSDERERERERGTPNLQFLRLQARPSHIIDIHLHNIMRNGCVWRTFHPQRSAPIFRRRNGRPFARPPPTVGCVTFCVRAYAVGASSRARRRAVRTVRVWFVWCAEQRPAGAYRQRGCHREI